MLYCVSWVNCFDFYEYASCNDLHMILTQSINRKSGYIIVKTKFWPNTTL